MVSLRMWSLRQPALPPFVWAPPDRPPDYDLASARVSPFPCRLRGPDEPPCSAAAGYLYAFPCIHTAGRRNRGLGYGFSYAVTGPLGCRTSWGTWCTGTLSSLRLPFPYIRLSTQLLQYTGRNQLLITTHHRSITRFMYNYRYLSGNLCSHLG